jgi:hypothetical protein
MAEPSRVPHQELMISILQVRVSESGAGRDSYGTRDFRDVEGIDPYRGLVSSIMPL